MAKLTLRLGDRIFVSVFCNLGWNQSRDVVWRNGMWYAVWVKTGQEEKILQMCSTMLSEQCFLPRYELKRKMDG